MSLQFSLSLAAVACVGSMSFAQNITFTQTDRTIQYPATSMISGDINRDGYPDFEFQVGTSTNIYTLLADGKGSYLNWTIPTKYCPSVPLVFGDFQRNGANDLLVSTTNGPSCVSPRTYSFGNYANNGHGIFSLYDEVRVNGFESDWAVVADVNGDGKLDVITMDNKALDLYYGNGYGSFAGPYTIVNLGQTAHSLDGNFYNVIVGDYDGNGCPDVAWTDQLTSGQYILNVAYGDCHGSFALRTEYTASSANVVLDNIQTADLNRDGISDIVATYDASGQNVTSPQLVLLYGQKNLTFTTKLIADSSLTGPIQVADFNGDGYPDVAYLSSSAAGDSIRIRQGDAAQSFTGISDHPLSGLSGSVIDQMIAGDFNRDGKTDLAVLASVAGASATADFTLLSNTSAYAAGACVPPVASGIHVCSPGATSGTTVNVDAAAMNDNPTAYMELWVDGVKRIGYGSTRELRTTLTLAVGKHQFAYFSSDAAGNKNSLVTSVTVQ